MSISAASFVTLTICSAIVTAQDMADVRELTPGSAIEREIKTGERHLYRIALQSQQYLRVLVSEREMSVAVEPIAPGDRHLFEVDDRSAMGKPMRLSLIADSAGEYRLVVRPAAGQRAAGKYALRIEELREARPEDRSRVASEKVYAEAQQFYFQR